MTENKKGTGSRRKRRKKKAQKKADTLEGKVAPSIEEALRTTQTYASQPLVHAIERLALGTSDGPLPDEELPEWFEEWARATLLAGRFEVARFAARFLHRHNHPDKKLAAIMVGFTAKACDLVILEQGFTDTVIAPDFAEFRAACASLPSELANALVAAWWPEHRHAPSATVLLSSDVHKLDLLEAREGGGLARVLHKIRWFAEDTAKTDEYAPQHEAFIQRVRALILQFGDLYQVSRETLLKTIEQEALPEVCRHFLERAVSAPLWPEERLVQALLLTRAIDGTEHQQWLPGLLYSAAEAIYDLRAVNLFTLRIELLNRLLEHGKPPYITTAQLYFGRGITSLILALESQQFDESLADLFEAFQMAKRDGDSHTMVESVAMAARTLRSKFADGDSQKRELSFRLLSLVNELHTVDLDPKHQATLLHTEAILRGSEDLTLGLALRQQALDLLEPGVPYTVDLSIENVRDLRQLGRIDEAVALARQVLASLPDQAKAPTRIEVLSELGLTLETKSPGSEEALGHLLQAAKLARARYPVNEASCLVQVADVAHRRGDEELLNESLLRLDALPNVPRYLRGAVAQLKALAAQTRGEFAEADETLEQATRATTGTDRVKVRLHRAALRIRENQRPSEDIDMLVNRAISDEVNDLLRYAEAFAFHSRLQVETLHRLAAFCEKHGQYHTSAFIRIEQGAHVAAIEIVERALAVDLDSLERLHCLHALIIAQSETGSLSRQRCAEVEALLAEYPGEYRVRLDFADVLYRSANGNVGVLLRARDHCEKAIQDLQPHRQALEHGHRLFMTLSFEIIGTSLHSMDKVAEIATSLTDERPVPSIVRGDLRLKAALVMMHVGPLLHPKVLAVVERLLNAARKDLGDTQQVRLATTRFVWINARQGGQGRLGTQPAGLPKGLADDAPIWLIQLVGGSEHSVPPKSLARSIDTLRIALQIRPDMADFVLAHVIPRWSEMPSEQQQPFLDVVYETVQNTREIDKAEPWKLLLAALPQPHSGEPWQLSSIRKFADNPDVTNPVADPTGDRAETNDAKIMRLFDEGVALMDQCRYRRLGKDTASLVTRAREMLAQAVELCRKQAEVPLFGCLVSLGNAWKLPHEPDLSRTFRCYAEAEKLAVVPGQKAQLWKVKADALLQRGGEEDIRRAYELVGRALEIRTDWQYVETQISAANVAKKHPDFSEVERVSRAVEHLMDGVRVRPSTAEKYLDYLRQLLHEWGQRSPTDTRPRQFLDELLRTFPDRADEIKTIPQGDLTKYAGLIVSMLEDPAVQAFSEIRQHLFSRDERRQQLQFAQRLAKQDSEVLKRLLDQTCLLDKPKALVEKLRTVENKLEGSSPQVRAGLCCGRAHLIVALVPHGIHSCAEAREATEIAYKSITTIQSVQSKVRLLHELASLWAPYNHVDAPVLDFAYARDLLFESLELQGGESSAIIDTLESLARAYRYLGKYEECKHFYQLVLARALAEGPADLAGNTLHNLAELEAQLGYGGRIERLRRSITLIQKAIDAAESGEKKAEFTASLAWERTVLADLVPEDETVEMLRLAQKTFKTVDVTLLRPQARQFLHRNRAVCLAHIERLTGGRNAEVRFWRKHLSEQNRETYPGAYATAQHNLATALLRTTEMTREEFREGIQLSEDAICERTLERDPRHHWETALLAGCALVDALHEHGNLPATVLPGSRNQSGEAAREWLSRAIQAGRALGPGEELVTAALALNSLAGAANPNTRLELAEESWHAIIQARPYLVLHRKLREREAFAALQTALNLMAGFVRSVSLLEFVSARPGTDVYHSPDNFIVIGGEKAGVLLRWLTRGFEPFRRPLRARLSRPISVSQSSWDDWTSALDFGEQHSILRALAEIRKACPKFLTEDNNFDEMWRWLRVNPGAVGVAVVQATPSSLCILVRFTKGGKKLVEALGVPLSPPPSDPHAYVNSMRNPDVDLSTREHAIHSYTQWLQGGLVDPILKHLKERPKCVLWCPSSNLRLVAPSSVWKDIPVVTCASFELLGQRELEVRKRSTMIAMAKPDRDSGPVGDDPWFRAVKELRSTAEKRGPTRIVGSIYDSYGYALFGETPTVRDTPASPQSLLAEAELHDVIVLLAHGNMDDTGNARIVGVDRDGARRPLDVATLVRHPESFAGATIILLSCETGLLGGGLAEPGNIAGTLLSAGARCVIAPLWPVRLSHAVAVGNELLNGLATGKKPWEVLTTLFTNNAELRGQAQFGCWIS